VAKFLLCVVTMLLTGLILCPAKASASWPLHGNAEILLGYGHPYIREGRDVTHHGVDLSAEPGDMVLSAQAGVVSFAGRVPAPGGGTRGAVTIEFSGGLRITCLPLAEIAVSKGQKVSAGEKIGILSEGVGESSERPHLHVSVRRGDIYLDPMTFLAPPVLESTQVAPAPEMMTNLVERGPAQGSVVTGAPKKSALAKPCASTVIKAPAPAKIPFPISAQTVAAPDVTKPAAWTIEPQRVTPLAESSIQVQESKIVRTSHLRELVADEIAQPHFAWVNGMKERKSLGSWWLSGVVTLTAAFGLWPLWRRRPMDSGEAVMSVREYDLAAAVCR